MSDQHPGIVTAREIAEFVSCPESFRLGAESESGTEAKAGQVRYWQYGQAGEPPNLAISDLSRFPLTRTFPGWDASH